MAQPASGKPSLLDNSPLSSGSGTESVESIRMLDALDPSKRSAQRVSAHSRLGWLLAGTMLLVACGAGWSWWSQRIPVEASADRSMLVGAAPATAAMKPPQAASAASAAAEPVVGATIIAMPDAATSSSDALAAASPLAASASPPASTAEAARLAAAAPAAKPKVATPVREARLTADPNIDRKRTAHVPSIPNRKTATATDVDPDVALLSAMLATMSRDVSPLPKASPSARAQLTIAQLVQRCDTRGVKDAIETFECKRRICDGYWGKAEACPMALSPKKN